MFSSRSIEVPIVILILCLEEYDPTLHVFSFQLECPFLDKFKYFSSTVDVAGEFLAIMFDDQVIVVVALVKLKEAQLLHADKVFFGEAELVLGRGVKLVQVGRVPAVLVIGNVELDLLTGDVEVRGICQCYEVD
jgi:hypothetical protein